MATLEAREEPDQLEVEPIIREQIPEIREPVDHIVITFENNLSFHRHAIEIVARAANVHNEFQVNVHRDVAQRRITIRYRNGPDERHGRI